MSHKLFLLYLTLFCLFFSCQMWDEIEVARVVRDFGNEMWKSEGYELNKYFTKDALFQFNNESISYNNAINNFKSNIKNGKIIGGALYGAEIEEIKDNFATTGFTFFVRFYDKGSLEASGYMILFKGDDGMWKIKEVSSDLNPFIDIFFR